MAERLKEFLKDVSALRAQQSAEQLARMDRLKAMTPEQFVRLPRPELHELTDRQYAEIVRHVAPEHRLPEPQEVLLGASTFWARLRWIAIPTAARAAALGVLTGTPRPPREPRGRPRPRLVALPHPAGPQRASLDLAALPAAQRLGRRLHLRADARHRVGSRRQPARDERGGAAASQPAHQPGLHPRPDDARRLAASRPTLLGRLT